MTSLPEREQQILAAHAGLIHGVVAVCANPALRPQLDTALATAEQAGWGALVAAIRQILAGRRDASLLAPLDDEDCVIVQAILRGVQDPTTLPDINARPDAVHAAPGLANMIHAASHGDVQALTALAGMAEQMLKVGGDMARLSAVLRPMVNGERDADTLTKGMGAQGKALVNSILDELGKLSVH